MVIWSIFFNKLEERLSASASDVLGSVFLSLQKNLWLVRWSYNWIILNDPKILIMQNEKVASAGSRTRIDCLEGNHANRYTTDASYEGWWRVALYSAHLAHCLIGPVLVYKFSKLNDVYYVPGVLKMMTTGVHGMLFTFFKGFHE